MTAMTMLADERESPGKNAMGSAALAIADELTGRDFEVRTPGWDGSHLLKVTVRGLLCEILVSASGSVEWECRPCDNSLADPARTAEMVRRILGGDAEDEPAEALPGWFGFKSVVGCMLADSGMAVSVKTCVDEHFFDAYSEIEVTNPVQPVRGRVRVADDGLVIWQSRIRTQSGDSAALDPGEIAGIIAQALAEQHRPGTRPARREESAREQPRS